ERLLALAVPCAVCDALKAADPLQFLAQGHRQGALILDWRNLRLQPRCRLLACGRNTGFRRLGRLLSEVREHSAREAGEGPPRIAFEIGLQGRRRLGVAHRVPVRELTLFLVVPALAGSRPGL